MQRRQKPKVASKFLHHCRLATPGERCTAKAEFSVASQGHGHIVTQEQGAPRRDIGAAPEKAQGKKFRRDQ
jgi:hypothetical protein